MFGEQTNPLGPRPETKPPPEYTPPNVPPSDPHALTHRPMFSSVSQPEPPAVLFGHVSAQEATQKGTFQNITGQPSKSAFGIFGGQYSSPAFGVTPFVVGKGRGKMGFGTKSGPGYTFGQGTTTQAFQFKTPQVTESSGGSASSIFGMSTSRQVFGMRSASQPTFPLTKSVSGAFTPPPNPRDPRLKQTRPTDNMPDEGAVSVSQDVAMETKGATKPPSRESKDDTKTFSLHPKKTVAKTGGVFGRAVSMLKKSSVARRRMSSGSSSVDVPTGKQKKVIPTGQLEQIKSICCQDVPEGIGKKKLEIHFSQFGKVVRISLNNKKRVANVHYDNHDAAAAAKKHGVGGFFKGSTMKIFYSSLSPKSASPKSLKTSSAETAKQDRLKKMEDKMRQLDETRQIQKQMWRKKKLHEDPDITEELNAMGGGLVEPETKKAMSPSRSHKSASKGKAEKEDVPLSGATMVPELKSIVKQAAFTAGERFKVLDARDRLLRLGLQSKRSDLSLDKQNVGTCPDMCPEKERYMRQEQRQLASYETGDRKEYIIDHRAAIKQYSRSSADQEEPLPHELRPTPVLTMTMDYFVNSVMDRSEALDENLGDWYHFVWDRTRGIRKDVTQQQLCSPESVALVEKCARFHIHCAERLCEEDMSVFDQKINNENLTKCLQTLKELYSDLDEKGIHCHSEAEFRAYDVLLNLNEGDSLRQVTQLREEVHSASCVRFAVSCLLALDSHNYVQFFNLVRKATYLEACILQRYFVQVRTHALRIILRAYCPPGKSINFPMAELIELLGFEGPMEASHFCAQHGLVTDDASQSLILDKRSFHSPESAPTIFRASKLIESKRTCSIGEVINGSPLPPNPYLTHVPHNSFNEHGFLTSSVPSDSSPRGSSTPPQIPPFPLHPSLAQPDIAPEHPPPLPVPLQPDPLEHQRRQMEEEACRDRCCQAIVEEISYEYTDRESKRLCMAVMVEREGYQVLQEIITEVSNQMCREVCEDAMAEAKAEEVQKWLALEEEKRKKREKEITIAKVCVEIHESLLKDVTAEMAAGVAALVVAQERVALSAARTILFETIASELKEVASETLQEAIGEHEENVSRLNRQAHQFKMRKLFIQWRRRLKAKRKGREESVYLASFFTPLHDGSDIPATNLEEVASQREKVQLLGKAALCMAKLSSAMEKKPLDIIATVANEFGPDCYRRQRLEWKVLVVVGSKYHRWVQAKLHSGEDREVSVYHDGKLWVCIRSCTKSPIKHDVQGAHGIVFINDGRMDLMEDVLHVLPSIPSIPVAVMTLGGCVFSLHDSMAELVSQVEEVELKFQEPAASLALKSLLQWLARFRPSPPNVRVLPLKDWAEDNLTSMVLEPFFQDFSMQWQYRQQRRHPNSLISVYNSAVVHLARIWADPSLLELSWPAPELLRGNKMLDPPGNWNSLDYLHHLTKSIVSLQLPLYQDSMDILQYCRGLKRESASTALLLSKVASLTEKPCDFHAMPWLHLIQACMYYQLATLPDEMVACPVDATEGFQVRWPREVIIPENPSPEMISPKPITPPPVQSTLVKILPEYDLFRNEASKVKEELCQTEHWLKDIIEKGKIVNISTEGEQASTSAAPCAKVPSPSKKPPTLPMKRKWQPDELIEDGIQELRDSIQQDRADMDAFEKRLQQILSSGPQPKR